MVEEFGRGALRAARSLTSNWPAAKATSTAGMDTSSGAVALLWSASRTRRWRTWWRDWMVMVSPRRSNARWGLIEPVLSAWRFERWGGALDFGRPPEHDLREIMDAISYVDRTGVQWRYLPHDFPHWNTVYGYFATWADEGVFTQLNGLIRRLLCEKEGRDAEPSACVIDGLGGRRRPTAPRRTCGRPPH